MNAIFGIIFERAARARLLIKLPKEIKTWGNEDFKVGEEKFTYAALSDVELRASAVHDFIRSLLPEEMQGQDLEYASIKGAGIEKYIDWLRENSEVSEEHPFEIGMKLLVRDAGRCALMLISGDENLKQHLVLVPEEVPSLLRSNLKNVACSLGFIASVMPVTA